MNIIISNSSMEPIYEQIIRQIKTMIMEKKLKNDEGVKLAGHLKFFIQCLLH